MNSLSTRILTIFSFVIMAVVGIISILVQHYVTTETTKKETLNARLQNNQTIEMMDIAWENHLYHRQTLLDERKNLLRDVTSIAFGVIRNARKRFLQNEITETEAKKIAMDMIRRMRFADGAGYFWIQDTQKPIPYMLMHPVVPALDGKPADADVCYTALDDGSNLNATFVKQCEKDENNEAFLPYKWPKPTMDGLTAIQPKLSFVKIFPEWGWLVGTGLYIDDIEKESKKNLEQVKKKIIENLSEIQLGKSGYIFIFDRDYNFIAHPIYKGMNGGNNLRPDTGTPILKDLANHYESGFDTMEYEWGKPGSGEDEHFSKIALISYFEPLGWYVCGSVYTDELKAPAQQLMTKILLASSVLLGFALLLAWRLSRSVSKPIVHLAATAKKIGNGEVDAIEFLSADLVEIETLVTCLQDMLLSLNQASERLRQKQKMEAIGQLAGGIAHDFNNMLAGIIGCAAILENRLPKDSPHLKYVEMINTSANRAAEFSTQLLAFGRKQELFITNVDIHDVIKDAVAILEKTIDKQTLISSKLKAAEHVVCGEYAQLQAVFINLGINASHAMQNGGSLIFSTRVFNGEFDWGVGDAFSIAPNKQYVEINVADTGVGMSPEILERIFEPFFTTKIQGKGTGLGLASAYGTIQQHKGTIKVESALGEGSRFKILLPLSANTEVGHDFVDLTGSELVTGQGTVLVVDDEEVLRVSLEGLLTNCGYNVLLAENGKEATRVYSEQSSQIDAVICDMIMPEMGGYECFQKLKKINPEVKFIIASGFTKDDSIKEMKEKGLSGFVKKPFKGTTISQLLAQVIQKTLSP